MNRRILKGLGIALSSVVVLGACGGGGSKDSGDKPEVVIGIAGARVGPIANIGTGIGEAITDWVDMVNAKGGVNGRKIKIVEVETQYQVPPAIEAFSRFQQAKAALVVAEGTAITDALTPVSQQSKIPLFFPGQGNLETVDGTKLPYVFPAGPLYAHQASALVDYLIKDRGADVKISCLAWESPAGREYCAGAKSAAEAGGANFVGEVVFPSKAVDLTPQIKKLVALGADVNLQSGVFGQATLAYKGLCEQAPDATIGTWHWGVTLDALKGAGAECMEGALGTSMSSLVSDEPEAIKMLRDYWKESGTKANSVMDENSTYSNGLYFGTVIEEAVRLADKKVGDGQITGEDMKVALESVTNFDGHGIACPITMSAKDHSGNRAVNIYQVKSGKFVKIQSCVTGPAIAGEPDVS